MAWNFSQINLTPLTGAAAVFALKTALKAVGWTVPKSSDGTTYNAAGDQITLGTSGAGGMANNLAWFVVAAPTGTRQLCFQRSAAGNTTWRITYSKASGFSTGAPSATQVPSAADGQMILGSGTDGAPGFGAWFGTADGGYRFSAVVNDAAPYGFFTFGFPTGGGNPTHGFMMDPMDPVASAVFATGDTDPVVFAAGSFGAWQGDLYNALSGYPQGRPWVQGALWTHMVNGLPLSLTTDPTTGLDAGRMAPLYYEPARFWKGYGTIWAWHFTGGSATPSPKNRAGANDTLVVGFAELPWNGGSPVV